MGRRFASFAIPRVLGCAAIAAALGALIAAASGLQILLCSCTLASAAAVACVVRCASLQRAELVVMSSALSQAVGFVLLAMLKALPAGTDPFASIDLNVVQRDAVRLAKARLASKRFRLIDVNEELRISEERAQGNCAFVSEVSHRDVATRGFV